jgi:hypothetical protein
MTAPRGADRRRGKEARLRRMELSYAEPIGFNGYHQRNDEPEHSAESVALAHCSLPPFCDEKFALASVRIAFSAGCSA